MLPPVFAIYRPGAETFQFIATDVDETGLVRFKNWRRPDPSEIEDAHELDSWKNGGQEWYVVPTHNQGSSEPPHCHSFTLHNQEYRWWSLRHCLVWSDYLTHARRHGEGLAKWMRSPRIPILECSSKLIYPRTIIEIYPRWCDSSPKKLEMESKQGHIYYKNMLDRPEIVTADDHVDPKDLRIRTPQPKDDEEEGFTPDSLHKAQHYCPRPKSWSGMSDELIDEFNSNFYPSSCAQSAARALIVGICGLFITGTFLMVI